MSERERSVDDLMGAEPYGEENEAKEEESGERNAGTAES